MPAFLGALALTGAFVAFGPHGAQAVTGIITYHTRPENRPHEILDPGDDHCYGVGDGYGTVDNDTPTDLVLYNGRDCTGSVVTVVPSRDWRNARFGSLQLSSDGPREPEPSDDPGPSDRPNPSDTADPSARPDPAHRADPTDDDDPSDNGDPSDSGDPSDAGDPSDNGDPADPADSADPSDNPESPANPEDPDGTRGTNSAQGHGQAQGHGRVQGHGKA
ncbi:chitin-binding protein [Streptomyces sp. NBC_01456]|uniref:chitin-binding protein n=1 Tax=unclassified Streptomyces TaxID=2593676 RepID=UPI002E2F691A|nr:MULTISPECIES: chitin-binding protein [unclassified Streptomyces]